MTSFFSKINRRRYLPFGAAVLALALGMFGLAACQPDADAGSDAAVDQPDDAPSVVEVTAKDYAFQAPDTVRPGWTTFRMPNTGKEVHFMYLGRLPEGKTFADYKQEVLVPFDSVYHRYRTENLSRAQGKKAFIDALPDWFADAEVWGGTGLASPGNTAQATVKLEPGNYWMECYMKAPDGRMHTSLGMLRSLTVAGDSTGAAPPEADLEITLSNDGMDVRGTPTAGRQTVKVHIREHPENALFMNNDIHVVRLSDGSDLGEIARWMDAWQPEGLRTPAPAQFVGGTQEVRAGDTSYFSVDLTTGRYAWIAEVPNPQEKGMLKTFTIE